MKFKEARELLTSAGIPADEANTMLHGLWEPVRIGAGPEPTRVDVERAAAEYHADEQRTQARQETSRFIDSLDR